LIYGISTQRRGAEYADNAELKKEDGVSLMLKVLSIFALPLDYIANHNGFIVRIFSVNSASSAPLRWV
jgi:hypothetical protein